MKQIILNYKDSISGSWQSAPLTADCLSLRSYVLPNIETKDSEFRRASGKKCSTKTPRLYFELRLSPTNFDPESTTAGTTNWIYVQKWYCAPIVHITTVPTTEYPDVDGITACATSSNTMYWNVTDISHTFEDFDTGDRRLRWIEITIESTDKYQL